MAGGITGGTVSAELLLNRPRSRHSTLAQALQSSQTRAETAEALRGLIDAIVLTPAEDGIRIELKGNLAAMLGATVQRRRSPETGDLSGLVLGWLLRLDSNQRPG
jgi:hypothetical protein